MACSSILRFTNPAAIKNGVDMYSLWGIYDWDITACLQQDGVRVSKLLSGAVALRPASARVPVAFCPECAECVHRGVFPGRSWRALQAKTRSSSACLSLPISMRARRVLQTVAEKAGWGKPMPKGKGRGIAQHTCFGTSTAQVAEISVNETTGAFKVDRVVVAVDCGPVVNPAPLVAQIQGGVLMALSTVLQRSDPVSRRVGSSHRTSTATSS